MTGIVTMSLRPLEGSETRTEGETRAFSNLRHRHGCTAEVVGEKHGHRNTLKASI